MRAAHKKHTLQIGFSIIWGFIFILLCNIAPLNAQVTSTPRPNADPQQFNEINNRLDSIQKSIAESLSTIASASKDSIESSSRAVTIMGLIYSVAGGIIGAAILILGYFGIKEVRSISDTRRDIEKQIDERLKNMQSQVNEFLNQFKVLGTNFEERFNGLIRDAETKLKMAEKKLSEARETETDLFVKSRLEGFNTLLDDIKAYNFTLERVDEILRWHASGNRIGDRILAAVHGVKAYTLKRKDRLAEALASVEEAHKLNSESVIHLYNCACYASLLDKKDKALDYLERLVKIIPEWKGAILKEAGTNVYKLDVYNLLEEDFKSIKDEPRFKSILGVSSYSQINLEPKNN